MIINLENLKSLYPKIDEVFGRAQLYRQNNLPIELNEIIENYCLDLDNINGPNSMAWTSKELFDTSFASCFVMILKFWRMRNSNHSIIHDVEFILCRQIASLKNLFEQYEKRFEIEWKKDKRNYFEHRKLVFDPFQSKEDERLLSLSLQKTSLEVKESIESNFHSEAYI